MQLKYEDGEQEDLVLSKERIKFHISLKEMQSMGLKLCEKSPEADELDANEMMVLAATLDDDCQEIETGDLIWAKLTGLSLICFWLYIKLKCRSIQWTALPDHYSSVV